MWIWGLFLSISLHREKGTDTCLSVHKAHTSADNYFGFSVMLPLCTYRYKLFTQLNMFSQCCEKVGIL